MTDKSLVVIATADAVPTATAFAAAIGYGIAFTVPLSDDGETVTHYALHAAAGPVMRLVLAGTIDPEEYNAGIIALSDGALGALAEAGYTADDVAALRAAMIVSVRGEDESFGISHLHEVMAANGLTMLDTLED